MATITPPYADPGRAAFEVLDTYLQNHLLTGSHPELAPAFSFPIAFSQTLEQFEVVGLVAGELVPATYNADPSLAVKPIGIMAHAAARGASGAAVNGQVFYSGCFNVAALVWDATFTTAALKLAAFHGSPTPTNIIVASRG